MTPRDKSEPKTTVDGRRSRIAATNSATPLPIRPQGSMKLRPVQFPTVVKMYTDSFAPVNLKNKVWSKMTAAMPRSVQLVMINALLWFILPFLVFEKLCGFGFSEISLEKPRLRFREVHDNQSVQGVREFRIHIESEQ